MEGPPGRSYAQNAADALQMLLDDLTGLAPGSGHPPPAQVSITVPAATLTGTPGSPPGVLHTALGPIRLAPGVTAALGCHSELSTVTLPDSGQPFTASGSHRHATRRERRALRARWGGTCAVNGCTHPGTIPHHAEPWWKTHNTTLTDLVPLCPTHHHDIHQGHRTLRLRDNRLIDEHGWTQRLRQAA